MVFAISVNVGRNICIRGATDSRFAHDFDRDVRPWAATSTVVGDAGESDIQNHATTPKVLASNGAGRGILCKLQSFPL